MDSATTLNLGCGTDIREDTWNVDGVDVDGVDQVVDLDDAPWPWPDDAWNVIIAEHVFEHVDNLETALRECARVLEAGGRLVTRWPIGYDARADPDHTHEWYWQTPKMYCGERHWDTDTGMSVVNREVELSTVQNGLLWHVHQRYLDWKLDHYGPGPWCFVEPGCRGEFTVVFENA